MTTVIVYQHSAENMQLEAKEQQRTSEHRPQVQIFGVCSLSLGDWLRESIDEIQRAAGLGFGLDKKTFSIAGTNTEQRYK